MKTIKIIDLPCCPVCNCNSCDCGIKEYYNEIIRLQAELEKYCWIHVTEEMPIGYWGKKIHIIINNEVSTVKYYGRRIGMTHWKPIILPKKDLTND